ncbi:Os12g0163050, partial [Oryza sativa Japonica Group]
PVVSAGADAGTEQRRAVAVVVPVAVVAALALHVVELLLLAELPGELALLVAAPRALHEARAPAPPLVGVVPERVLQPLAVQPLELVGDVLEVLGAERERLHLGDRPHRPRRLREVEAGVGHERPGEELLAAEVAGAEGDGAKEVGPAAVGGGALELAADDEQHLADRVALADDVGVLGAQRGDEALADGVEQLLVHLGEEGDAADEGEAEVALDLSPEIERQRLEDGLLVDAPRRQPLVLEEPPHPLLQLQRQLPVAHPLLDVPPLHPPFLQPHRHRLQVRLHSPIQIK